MAPLGIEFDGKAQPQSATSPKDKNDGWWISLVLRWALLFSVATAYFILFLGNWGLWWSGLFAPGSASRDLLALPERLTAPYWHGAQTAMQWFGAHFFGLRLRGGQFSSLAVDIVGYFPPAFVWTIFDRGKRSNAVLREIVYLVVRFSLATGMFLYGSVKVIGQQGIPQPAPLDWFRPLGEIPAGQVMWTWLGYSPVFHFFAGMNESIGAILLLFRRTTLLAALLILPTMVYVAAMDVTFNVGPAASAALFGAGALYLMGRERQRLARVFLLAEPTAPTPRKKLSSSTRLAVAGRMLWVLVVSFALWSFPLSEVRERLDMGASLSPLCGAYRVKRFVSNGHVLPEDAADPTRWRDVSINWFGDFVRIRRMDGAEMLWSLEPGDPYRFLVATGHGYRYGDYGKVLAKTASAQGQLKFKALPNYGGPSTASGQDEYFGALAKANPRSDEFYTLNYVRNDDELSLQGRVDGADISVDLHKIDGNSLPFVRSRELR